MQELTIKKFPDPVLRKKASKVSKVTPQIKEILSEMAKIMYLSQGVGLAALQVGVDKQLAVVDIGDGPIMFVNPIIVKKDGFESFEEGCLSVPEVSVKIKRSKSVKVQYLDECGNPQQLQADGLLARAIQHELDHLKGILIIDYVNPVKKILLKRRLTKRK